jgi:hypothetical protein
VPQISLCQLPKVESGRGITGCSLPLEHWKVEMVTEFERFSFGPSTSVTLTSPLIFDPNIAVVAALG